MYLALGLTNTNIKAGDLYLNLDHIRNNEGVIYIFLYDYENQYPYQPTSHFKVKKSNVKNGKLIVRLTSINFKNNYAISILDDENDNEDLDRFLGIPVEGFGFSNNIKTTLSLPNYKDLLFNFQMEKRIPIDLQYYL